MQMRAAIVALLLAFASPALAHDFWIDKTRVDPQTKFLCCGESDCKLIPLRSAHPTSAGYLLDDTGETIPWPRVQPSPDGGIWACRWGGGDSETSSSGLTKCFFAPIPGA